MRHRVNVIFDSEARHWVTMGGTIPGMALGSPDKAELERKVRQLAPTLCDANGIPRGPVDFIYSSA